jgi:hypothetical protein
MADRTTKPSGTEQVDIVIKGGHNVISSTPAKPLINSGSWGTATTIRPFPSSTPASSKSAPKSRK